MFYTYVLLSRLDHKFYIGCTSDLKKRFQDHISGEVEATSLRLPVDLVYYEACINKENAYKREKYFKTGFGRRYLETRI